MSQRSAGGAPGTPASDEARALGLGSVRSPSPSSAGPRGRGEAQPLAPRQPHSYAVSCQAGRAPAVASSSLPEAALQLQPSSPSPGQGAGLWHRAQPGSPADATGTGNTDKPVCSFPTGPSTPRTARPHYRLSSIPITHPSTESNISHPWHPGAGTGGGGIARCPPPRQQLTVQPPPSVVMSQ